MAEASKVVHEVAQVAAVEAAGVVAAAEAHKNGNLDMSTWRNARKHTSCCTMTRMLNVSRLPAGFLAMAAVAEVPAVVEMVDRSCGCEGRTARRRPGRLHNCIFCHPATSLLFSTTRPPLPAGHWSSL